MSGSPQPTYQTITVEEGYLPAPATKLIITQHLKFSQDPPFWAWIIVGAFYDHEDTVLWSTQVFAGHLDIEVESDEEESDVESEPERASSADLGSPEFDNWVTPQFGHFQHYQQSPQAYHPEFYFPPLPPQVSWDPTHQGPVQGHWQAQFDPNIRRWIHNWVPFH